MQGNMHPLACIAASQDMEALGIALPCSQEDKGNHQALLWTFHHM
jgi:hypothetical protein